MVMMAKEKGNERKGVVQIPVIIVISIIIALVFVIILYLVTLRFKIAESVAESIGPTGQDLFCIFVILIPRAGNIFRRKKASI